MFTPFGSFNMTEKVWPSYALKILLLCQLHRCIFFNCFTMVVRVGSHIYMLVELEPLLEIMCNMPHFRTNFILYLYDSRS